jgi:hypothetical protein
MDIYKWIDHVLSLNLQAKKLLLALHGMGLVFEKAKSNANATLTYTFKEAPLRYEKMDSPKTPSLEILMDPGISQLRKLILKQFPEVGDISKVNAH